MTNLSLCCKAPLSTSYGDEGTNCWICTKCQKPSDPVQDCEWGECNGEPCVHAPLPEYHQVTDAGLACTKVGATSAMLDAFEKAVRHETLDEAIAVVEKMMDEIILEKRNACTGENCGACTCGRIISQLQQLKNKS